MKTEYLDKRKKERKKERKSKYSSQNENYKK